MAAIGEAQIDRLVGAIRAQNLILQTTVAYLLMDAPDGAALQLRRVVGDKFADAVPEGKMPVEREARINHLSAHFAEEFWTGVDHMLAGLRSKG